jgi:hypothetical protein
MLEDVFESTFKKIGLKAVRLKCDPLNPTKDYIGYVLRENTNGTLRVHVIGMDEPFMDIPQQNVNMGDYLTSLEKLKLIIAMSIDQNIACGVQNIPTIEELKQYLLMNGMSYEEICDLMCCFFKIDQ